jgi:predicted ATPase
LAFSNIEDRLMTMERFDLVQRDAGSADFEFKHVLVRDALYDSLLSSQRSELHLKVAKAIERRGASRINEVAETLAYHYSLSMQHDKAFRYCSLSGRKCLDIYSLEESERYFRKALSLLSRAPQCADNQAMATVVASLLEVLYLRGDLLGLREIAEQYIPRLQTFGDTPQLVFALYFHCMLLAHHCEFAAAEGRAKLALAIAQRLNVSTIFARRPTRNRLSCTARRFLAVTLSKRRRSRAAECSMSVFDPETIIFSTGPIGRSPGIMSAAG